jgi:hypothetical protein
LADAPFGPFTPGKVHRPITRVLLAVLLFVLFRRRPFAVAAIKGTVFVGAGMVAIPIKVNFALTLAVVRTIKIPANFVFHHFKASLKMYTQKTRIRTALKSASVFKCFR